MPGRVAKAVPAQGLALVAIGAAALAIRLHWATLAPIMATALFAWIVADALMLALVARTAGRPGFQAALGCLATACLVVAWCLPAALRAVLWQRPVVVGIMAGLVVGHVACGLVQAIRVLRQPLDARPDALGQAVAECFLPRVAARLIAAELAVVHLALFRWGGPPDVPPGCRAFAYHRHLVPMILALLGLSAVEVAVTHVLVAHWSRTAALLLFVFSDFGFVYLLGLLKSLRLKPILLTPTGIRVRAGILRDVTIPLDQIAAIETQVSADGLRDPTMQNMALLAWPNVVLVLRRPLERPALWKARPAIRRVAFRLDAPEPFLRLLRWRLGLPAPL